MIRQSPSPSFLALWVAFSDFAEQALREEGYIVHADIISHSAFVLLEKWTAEHGECFESSFENLLSYVHVEGGCQQ